MPPSRAANPWSEEQDDSSYDSSGAEDILYDSASDTPGRPPLRKPSLRHSGTSAREIAQACEMSPESSEGERSSSEERKAKYAEARAIAFGTGEQVRGKGAAARLGRLQKGRDGKGSTEELGMPRKGADGKAKRKGADKGIDKGIGKGMPRKEADARGPSRSRIPQWHRSNDDEELRAMSPQVSFQRYEERRAMSPQARPDAQNFSFKGRGGPVEGKGKGLEKGWMYDERWYDERWFDERWFDEEGWFRTDWKGKGLRKGGGYEEDGWYRTDGKGKGSASLMPKGSAKGPGDAYIRYGLEKGKSKSKCMSKGIEKGFGKRDDRKREGVLEWIDGPVNEPALWTAGDEWEYEMMKPRQGRWSNWSTLTQIPGDEARKSAPAASSAATGFKQYAYNGYADRDTSLQLSSEKTNKPMRGWMRASSPTLMHASSQRPNQRSEDCRGVQTKPERYYDYFVPEKEQIPDNDRSSALCNNREAYTSTYFFPSSALPAALRAGS